MATGLVCSCPRCPCWAAGRGQHVKLFDLAQTADEEHRRCLMALLQASRPVAAGEIVLLLQDTMLAGREPTAVADQILEGRNGLVYRVLADRLARRGIPLCTPDAITEHEQPQSRGDLDPGHASYARLSAALEARFAGACSPSSFSIAHALRLLISRDARFQGESILHVARAGWMLVKTVRALLANTGADDASIVHEAEVLDKFDSGVEWGWVQHPWRVNLVQLAHMVMHITGQVTATNGVCRDCNARPARPRFRPPPQLAACDQAGVFRALVTGLLQIDRDPAVVAFAWEYALKPGELRSLIVWPVDAAVKLRRDTRRHHGNQQQQQLWDHYAVPRTPADLEPLCAVLRQQPDRTAWLKTALNALGCPWQARVVDELVEAARQTAARQVEAARQAESAMARMVEQESQLAAQRQRARARRQRRAAARRRAAEEAAQEASAAGSESGSESRSGCESEDGACASFEALMLHRRTVTLPPVRIPPPTPTAAETLETSVEVGACDSDVAEDSASCEDSEVYATPAASIGSPSSVVQDLVAESPTAATSPDGSSTRTGPAGGQAAAQAEDNADDKAEDNADLDEECLICMDGPRETTLVPCRHRVLCRRCARAVMHGTRRCPLGWCNSVVFLAG